MEILKKRETPLQNLAYIGIMSAINIAFILFCEFVSFLLFIFIFVLSLASSIVTIYCKAKYIPIYILVTGIICCFINLGDTLFYVVPTLISGSIFGLAVKKQLSPIAIITLTLVAQVVITYPCLGIYKAIFDIDLIPEMINMFGLGNNAYQEYLIALFIVVIALSQTVITYVVNSYQFTKLHIEIKNRKNDNKMIMITLLSLSLLSIIFSLFYGPIALVLMLVTLALSICESIQIFKQKEKTEILFLSIVFILVLMLTLIFRNYIEMPLGWLILLVYPVVVGFYLLIDTIKRTRRLYK